MTQIALTQETDQDLAIIINEAMEDDNRTTLEAILQNQIEIHYEQQVELADHIFAHQQDLAMDIFEGVTPIELATETLAKAAFRGDNEKMVDFLMTLAELQETQTRAAIFQHAINWECVLVRKFTEEIITIWLDTQDQRVWTPIIPEMKDVEDCFIF